jgi:hypothetical protein
MSKNGSAPPFEGFSRPNYTQVPDELFDVLMPDLTEAELRVLLYIIRRTFGFKKDSESPHRVMGWGTHSGHVFDGSATLKRRPRTVGGEQPRRFS